MRSWRVSFDGRSGLFRHTVSPGFGHALLGPLVCHAFHVLKVPASLWDGREWLQIHSEPESRPNIVRFELEHGVEMERGAYNERCLQWIRKHGRPLLAEHAGYADLFVPIVVDKNLMGILVTGPFAKARATATDILERWRWLTGRQGHPADAEFASYLAATFETLVLDADKARDFERLCVCLAELMAGEGRADELTNRAHALLAEIEQARAVERTWEAVRAMVDERSEKTWQSVYLARGLKILGLTALADHVLVGLTLSGESKTDPVEEAVSRDAFQRRAVELARSVGDVLAGPVGDHGVVFLSASSGAALRKKQKLLDLAERARALARREFGLSLFCGASAAPGRMPLSNSYQKALAAAENALTHTQKFVMADAEATRPGQTLRELRRALSQAGQQNPELMQTRFERYLDGVATRTAHSIEGARAYLECGFEQVALPLLTSGAVDEKSLRTINDGLDRAASGARTMAELSASYRRALGDLVEAVRRPVPARHDRSLRTAVAHIHQHYTEDLRVTTVARLAGFTPNYFSELFREREGTTFADYVRGLRIERSKQLLTGSDLPIGHVARLCGFHSLDYFGRAFKQALGKSPLEYRREPGAVRREKSGRKLSKVRTARARSR